MKGAGLYKWFYFNILSTFADSTSLVKGPVCKILGQLWNIKFIIMFSFMYNHLKTKSVVF